MQLFLSKRLQKAAFGLILVSILIVIICMVSFTTPQSNHLKSSNMIHIETFVFSAFHQNTYLLSDETKECVIIDPGCYDAEEKATLKEYIEKNELKLVAVLFTHCHLDHAFGARYVSENWPNIAFIAHKNEEMFITDAIKHAARFGMKMEQPPQIGHYIVDGETFTFGNTSLLALHVPGHSPGSICYYSESQNFVITGDVVFRGSVGRSDLPGGSAEQLISGIKSKLLVLPENTVFHPGHGESTTVLNEKRTNPYLR